MLDILHGCLCIEVVAWQQRYARYHRIIFRVINKIIDSYEPLLRPRYLYKVNTS